MRSQALSARPASLILPTTVGPIHPDRFAHMLMKPIDTAAADADSVSVGNTQNGDAQKTAKKPNRHSQENTSPHDWFGSVLSTRKVPVATCPVTQCHLRSPVRSDDCPDNQTPPRPQR